jgi:BirA family transcriptional regulator, biotin operon repressor / biotin---[acetyl-CoA-carboxylase] ligase
LTPAAPDSAFGVPRRHYRLVDSTNERGRELAAAGAPGGTIVTATEQTAGRGRRGRRWTAPSGKALLVSAILAPLRVEHALLPLAVPLAVCEAVESLAPLRGEIKWPNDVWHAGRKLAGVLIEAQPPDWAVIGIGLNVSIEPDEFPDDLRQPATSVGHGVGTEEALEAVCATLGEWADAPPERVLAEFEARDALRGRRVGWMGAGGAQSEGSGVADGIDEGGNLVVVTDQGERLSLGSGEVTLTVARAAREQR